MGLPLRALGLAAGLAAVVAALVRRLHTLQVELEQAQAESSRQMKLRSEERAGRTKVERKLREQSRAPAAEASTAHSYSPIGYLTSCYVERRGTPRQGCLVPSARAQLKVSSQTVQAVAALDGLAQFSHVWLVYDFHQNTTTETHGAIDLDRGKKCNHEKRWHINSHIAESKPKRISCLLWIVVRYCWRDGNRRAIAE